jgi:Flp pilus assembly pilin Flp
LLCPFKSEKKNLLLQVGLDMSSLNLKEFMCSTSDRYCLLDVTALEYRLLAVKTIQERTVPSSDAKAIEYGLIAETNTDRRLQVEAERRATAIEYGVEKLEPEMDGGRVKPRSGKGHHSAVDESSALWKRPQHDRRVKTRDEADEEVTRLNGRHTNAQGDQPKYANLKPRPIVIVYESVDDSPDSEWTKRDDKYSVLKPRPWDEAVGDGPDSEWTKRDVKYPILKPRPIIIVDRIGEKGPDSDSTKRSQNEGAAKSNVAHPDVTAIEYGKVKPRQGVTESAVSRPIWHRNTIDSRGIIEPNNIMEARNDVTDNGEVRRRDERMKPLEREGGAVSPDVSHMPGAVTHPTAVEYKKVKSRDESDGTNWDNKLKLRDQPGLTAVGHNRLKARQDEPDATAIEYALDSKPDTRGWVK